MSTINEELAKLSELNKVHYYWTPLSLIRDSDTTTLEHVARITRSMCMQIEHISQEEFDRCLLICKRQKVTIGGNYSPYHRVVKKGAQASDRGDDWIAEINLFLEKCVKFKRMAEIGEVEISCIMLDSERYARNWSQESEAQRENNKAIQQNLDVIHTIAVALFPNAKIIWYGRGMQMNHETGIWRSSSHWTQKEITQVMTCSLYTLDEMPQMVRILEKTIEEGKRLGIHEVSPYISLGASYQYIDGKLVFVFEYKYDPGFSKDMGIRVHRDWKSVKTPVFYPGPFDPRVPDWGLHFIEYVTGANLND